MPHPSRLPLPWKGQLYPGSLDFQDVLAAFEVPISRLLEYVLLDVCCLPLSGSVNSLQGRSGACLLRLLLQIGNEAGVERGLPRLLTGTFTLRSQGGEQVINRPGSSGPYLIYESLTGPSQTLQG